LKGGKNKMKKVAIICGTGVATSTVVVGKIKSFLENKGIKATIIQSKVSDIANRSEDFDLIISTTHVPSTVKTQTISGVPILTGVGADAVFNKIAEALS
jgi:galactitol PTS system EIIB component